MNNGSSMCTYATLKTYNNILITITTLLLLLSFITMIIKVYSKIKLQSTYLNHQSINNHQKNKLKF